MLQHIDAMKEAKIRVAVTHTAQMYVIMESGMVLPITGFYEEDKRTFCPPADASYYEFGCPEVGFAIARMPVKDYIHSDWNH